MLHATHPLLAGLTCAIALVLVPTAVSATPTELFNIPTVDTQPVNMPHIDVESLFTEPTTTDVGVLIGLTKRFEIGFDNIAPGSPTSFLNAKMRLVDETASNPALAVGAMLVGQAVAADEVYAVSSKHFGIFRLTTGAYAVAQEFSTLTKADRSGYIAGADVSSGKVSASIDRTGGRSPLGVTTFGVGYQVARFLNINPGYVWYNNAAFGKGGFELELHLDLH